MYLRGLFYVCIGLFSVCASAGARRIATGREIEMNGMCVHIKQWDRDGSQRRRRACRAARTQP